ncbi:hypothetical protein BX666DRAFT_1513783 [Dichotomocladium elegans]|nr:hypothetical protein BX666DRAFT_1513783 [Dichotomocladium elegans]
MDLSWCIICDNRIDSDMCESDLYCSAECKMTDFHPEIKDLYNASNSSSSSSVTSLSLPQSNHDVMLSKLKRAKSLRLQQQQQQQRQSYPWIPLYRRRPLVSKRPAPSSGGSAAATAAANVQGLLCRAKSSLPQPQFKIQSLLA